MYRGSYYKMLYKRLRKKFRTDEKITEWYEKFASSKRGHLQKMWINNPHCMYCGQETISPIENWIFGKLEFNSATYEHKIPLSKGGSNSRKNAGLSCHSCNYLKDNMTHDEFMNEIVSCDNNMRQVHAKIRSCRKKKESEPSERDIRRRNKMIIIIAYLIFDPGVKFYVEDYLKNNS